MLIDVEDKLIDLPKNTIIIEKQMVNFLRTNEGQNIKADIELLKDMGFDKKMINKVYILLRPENIERAIDYMSEIDGIYQHNFLPNSNPNETFLCFICKKRKQFHLDYVPGELLKGEQNNDLIENSQDIINIKDDIIQDNIIDDNGECEVCYEEINKRDIKLNSIPCGHLFCTHCWFNYLKTLITEAKVDQIKCMNHECNRTMTDEFIFKHISEDKSLIEKYNKFKKRVEIIKDKNKKLCPNPDCDSFLQKSDISKYVQCENGHKYCFDCLNPPHEGN